MPSKPVRTISIYDKGSTYLLLDSDDITPLYRVRWNTVTLPHMVVTQGNGEKSDTPIGTAAFIPMKRAGFSVADHVEISFHERRSVMTKRRPSESAAPRGAFGNFMQSTFSTDKRFFQTSRGLMCWKGGVAASAFLRLLDEQGNTVATYTNTTYDGRRMGKIDVLADPLTQEELDEIVISGVAMISEQKVSMSQTAASMASAGGMG